MSVISGHLSGLTKVWGFSLGVSTLWLRFRVSGGKERMDNIVSKYCNVREDTLCSLVHWACGFNF